MAGEVEKRRRKEEGGRREEGGGRRQEESRQRLNRWRGESYCQRYHASMRRDSEQLRPLDSPVSVCLPPAAASIHTTHCHTGTCQQATRKRQWSREYCRLHAPSFPCCRSAAGSAPPTGSYNETRVSA